MLGADDGGHEVGRGHEEVFPAILDELAASDEQPGGLSFQDPARLGVPGGGHRLDSASLDLPGGDVDEEPAHLDDPGGVEAEAPA